MEKVYCKNCKWLPPITRNHLACWFPEFRFKEKKRISYTKDMPERGRYRWQSDFNLVGECQFYQRRWWKFWC